MYVDSSTLRVNGKTYTRHLLRESFRDNGKVKHRTIANISSCTEEEIEAIRLALRHKHNLAQMGDLNRDIMIRQGLSVGAVWTLYDLARQSGLAQALGNTREGRLALWQVLARVIDQGSRLSAVRLATSHAACDVLNLETFNEDHLIKTWIGSVLSNRGSKIGYFGYGTKTRSRNCFSTMSPALTWRELRTS
jgi:hypothetical protein